MNPLQAVSKALQMRLEAFRRKPFVGSEEMLEGAARLAIDMGIIMNAPALIAEAQQVITWIRQWEEEQEKSHEIEMEVSHAAWLQKREPLYEASRLASLIVGREHDDPRWVNLVEAYRAAFPTFIVRNYIYARLDPTKMAFRLREFLSTIIEEKKLRRSPTEAEMRACLPEAKARLQTQTVTYLERWLPGFDFEGHAILAGRSSV